MPYYRLKLVFKGIILLYLFGQIVLFLPRCHQKIGLEAKDVLKLDFQAVEIKFWISAGH